LITYNDLRKENEFIEHYNIVENINDEQEFLIICIIILLFIDILHLQKILLEEGKLEQI